MGIEFLLPMIASILQGGIGTAIQAGQTARANNEQIRLGRIRREELQPIIDQLRTARDYTQMDEQLVRDFSRAADQMAAQSAQTGMSNAGSGGLDQVRRDVLGSMIASLAQTKAADNMQRQQMLADILSDPTLYTGEMTPHNAGLDALLGGLGGALAGAGSTLTAFLSTPEGIDILKGLGASKENPNNGPGIHAVPINSGYLPGVQQMASLGDFNMGLVGRPTWSNPTYGGGNQYSTWRLTPADAGF